MTMAELHDHLFEVLCVVDDICTKANVRYFLDSGTEIGAVREHDFIAWDDDADIKVLAEDYPAFKAAMEKYLPPYMHFAEPEDYAPAFYFFVGRVYDERYPIREANEEDDFYHNHLRFAGTDVFVFTKVPDSALAKKWLLLSNKVLYGMAMAHRYKIYYDKYSFKEKALVFGSSTIGKVLGKCLTAKRICTVWRKNVMRFGEKKSHFRFASNYGPKSLQFFPEDIFSGVAYFPIRGRVFPVPGGYHRELTQQYGDYMVPVKDATRYDQHMIIH